MQNVNIQQTTGNSYIIILKLMLTEYINNCYIHEVNLAALLKRLIKLNYPETEYTDFQNYKNIVKRGERLKSKESSEIILQQNIVALQDCADIGTGINKKRREIRRAPKINNHPYHGIERGKDDCINSRLFRQPLFFFYLTSNAASINAFKFR